MSLTISSKTSSLPEKGSATSPTVAMVLPFDPKMVPKQEIELALKAALADAEKQLLDKYLSENALPVIKRLQQAIRGLNFSTHKRSLAIFISTEVSRVVYLDFAVEQQLIVDRPFRIRDLADCKPSGKEYLLLLLSGRESKVYLKDATGLKLVKSNTPQNVYAYINEVPEKTGNFSDRDDRHEVVLNKFLHYMDVGLEAVLKAYPLPVFVAGTERITGHFARITKHSRNIAAYVNKHCMEYSETELQEMLKPMLDNWQQLRQQLLLLQMEKAAEQGKLVCGLQEARKAAGCSNSRVVIVEKEPDGPKTGFCNEGAVDQIVEKVLASGGDVEKLDSALLAKYGAIALIRYY